MRETLLQHLKWLRQPICQVNMKITIVTASYNAAKTIAFTINSIANQKNVDVEHLVIDGDSTDNTLSVIRECNQPLSLVSEPDKGIYDAMNKGIGLATGDIIGTLNADDFYSNEFVLQDVLALFEDPNVEACYGDLVYVKQDNTNKIVRYWKSKNYQKGLFKAGWMPPHPTFFVRKSVYDRLGRFNLNYKIAADFELLFRFIEQNKIQVKYLPKVLVKMRLGGTTNKNVSNILKQNREILVIISQYYPDFSVLKFVLSKIYNRYFQFTSKPEV